VEGLVTGAGFWRKRPVFVTGHTGFKGGWLSIWLERLGAEVHGYALDPPTTPSLYGHAAVRRTLATDDRGDLRDLPRLRAALQSSAAEVVFHLAAQPLVRASYEEPLATLQTNVIGTAHLLDACRETPSVRAVVVVTTDKVYEDRRSLDPYREADRLGGHDPYSASKAAAELVTASYRASFFEGRRAAPRAATARAGNVIGGGDWAKDRLIPDCMRAFGTRTAVTLRNPRAVRPWQHVLESLSGYLALAERLAGDGGEAFASAWNFGPDPADYASVGEVARTVAELWGDGARVVAAPSPDQPVETELLRLDSSRARETLRWRPRWTTRQAVAQTVSWYRAQADGKDMLSFTREQIAAYEAG
jgi:CDP-glucose 4,6-dehydratase